MAGGVRVMTFNWLFIIESSILCRLEETL